MCTRIEGWDDGMMTATWVNSRCSRRAGKFRRPTDLGELIPCDVWDDTSCFGLPKEPQTPIGAPTWTFPRASGYLGHVGYAVKVK